MQNTGVACVQDLCIREPIVTYAHRKYKLDSNTFVCELLLPELVLHSTTFVALCSRHTHYR